MRWMNNQCVTCCRSGCSWYFKLREALGIGFPFGGQALRSQALRCLWVLGSPCKTCCDALPIWKWKRFYSKNVFLLPIPCTLSCVLSSSPEASAPAEPAEQLLGVGRALQACKVSLRFFTLLCALGFSCSGSADRQCCLLSRPRTGALSPSLAAPGQRWPGSSGHLVTTNVVYWLVHDSEDANLGRSGA